jgi:hypothetical protein
MYMTLLHGLGVDARSVAAIARGHTPELAINVALQMGRSGRSRASSVAHFSYDGLRHEFVMAH